MLYIVNKYNTVINNLIIILLNVTLNHSWKQIKFLINDLQLPAHCFHTKKNEAM